MSFLNLLQSLVVIKKIGKSKRRFGKLTKVFRGLKKDWETHIMELGEMQEMKKGRRLERKTRRKSKKKKEDTLPMNFFSGVLFVCFVNAR